MQATQVEAWQSRSQKLSFRRRFYCLLQPLAYYAERVHDCVTNSVFQRHPTARSATSTAGSRVFFLVYALNRKRKRNKNCRLTGSQAKSNLSCRFANDSTQMRKYHQKSFFWRNCAQSLFTQHPTLTTYPPKRAAAHGPSAVVKCSHDNFGERELTRFCLRTASNCLNHNLVTRTGWLCVRVCVRPFLPGCQLVYGLVSPSPRLADHAPYSDCGARYHDHSRR